jgi:tetratricopeptide (TPR) repeat protein
VAVRLTGGDEITPEVKDFMSRYAVRGYPTLYVMNADGHVVVSKVNRKVDAMLQALADGEKAEQDFAEAKKKTDPEGRKAYLALLKSRMAWDDLASAQEADLKATPSAETYGELARTYASAGRSADEKATLEKALTALADAKERAGWRIRLATMENDPSKATTKEEYEKLSAATVKSLEELLAKFDTEKDAAGQAQSHLMLGNLQRAKPDDAEKHFDAALAADPKGRTAPTALMGKANCAFFRKDYAGCITQLEKIIAEFPDSDEAKVAPNGVTNCKKRMEAPPAKK